MAEASSCRPTTRSSRLAAPVAALALALLALTACSTEGAAGSKFKPLRAGVLSVATAFVPAPGFWQGHPPRRGFEAGLAEALAHRLGLDSVRVVQVPFTTILAGHFEGADLALSQMTPTNERERSVDFTTPYLTAPPGILALRRVTAIDVHGLQRLRWVTSSASTLTPIVMDRIRPKENPVSTVDRAQALAVLRRGGADALMLDLPVALGLAREQPGLFHVLGQLSGGEGLAAVLPKGSSNREVVDSAIRHLKADGTIDRLVSRWLGKSANDVPLILSEN